MSTGGYQAPSGSADFTPTGFGSDSPETSARNGPGSNIANLPLFGGDYKRHEDLKTMLDSNKDGQKRDAMKLIIGMIAKGKDCSELFPAVVKNVVSKESEIKKLVYVYLVRYAEEQQDLALLSISTFQKGLKDPNQLIRASALRVLSSIRVPIIAPIMMLAIKESVTDMSPFVRKTAAHAIPKLFSLDPELKDELVEVIEKLLKDQTTLVAGSVVMAFETVCPDRIDMIHKNYRKLCNLLVDVDEWGQAMILNMLTRYARTQFINPNQEVVEDAPFYEEEEKKRKKPKKKPYIMDHDHRMLLRNAKPLLQSRNAAVVMGVAQLYYHVAPRNEFNIIVKPLIRLLKSHTETQSVVLSNIATISADRSTMFEPYLKSFYVRSSDPTNIRLLKLDIIANVAGESSIHTILREFRTYISSSDKQFAAATIQAIGRVACSIAEVTEPCLHGLMSLLSHKSENVVGESVVVIKKLLQLHPKENKDLIHQVARLADTVTVPMAKASILWLVGEYSSLVPKIGPDVLRKAAQNFVNESEIVKLQTVNLAAKLVLSNPKQTKPLSQYVFSLAKYDQNYDIRDRARFLRQLVTPDEGKETALSRYAKKILLAPKPAPVLESSFKDRIHWQLGSLSHAINSEVVGYTPLSDFPSEAPDPSVRDVEDDSWWGRSKEKKKDNFYESESEESNFYSSISGSDVSGSNTEDSEEESGSEEESESDEGESGSEEDSEEEGEASSSDEEDALEKLKKRFGRKTEKEENSSEDSEEEESSEEETETESSSSEEEITRPVKTKVGTAKGSKVKSAAKGQEEPSLLDLDGWDDSLTTSTSSTGAPLSSMMASGEVDLLQPLTNQMADLSTAAVATKSTQQVIAAVHTPKRTFDLLNRITGNGLAVTYHFARRAHITSSKMVAIDITFKNSGDSTQSGIRTGSPQLQSGMKMNADVNIKSLTVGSAHPVTIGIDFNDTLQPAKFEISVSPGKRYPVQIDPLVGELLRPLSVSETEFLALKDKLTGMHENSIKLAATVDPSSLQSTILEVANMAPVATTTESTVRFAAVTFSAGLSVLLTVVCGDGETKIIVNCEKMVFNSMLAKSVKQALSAL